MTKNKFEKMFNSTGKKGKWFFLFAAVIMVFVFIVLNNKTVVNNNEISTSEIKDNETLIVENQNEVSVKVVGEVPNYYPKILKIDSMLNSKNGNIDFIVAIVEDQLVDSDASEIEVRIMKNPRMKISFDASLSTMNGKNIQNSDWIYNGSHPMLHKFIYKGKAGVFTGGTKSLIGLNGAYETEEGFKGTIPLRAVIKSGSGGQTKTSDDSVAVIFNYSN